MNNAISKLLLKLSLSALVFTGVGAVAKPASAATEWFNCAPSNVTEFSGRLVVSCSNRPNSNNNISALAFSTTNAEQAKRYLSMANTALVTGKYFRVHIEMGTPSNPPSWCPVGYCRVPSAFGVQNQ